VGPRAGLDWCGKTDCIVMSYLFFSDPNIYSVSECKGKAIPLEALAVPDGSRKLRLPDFKTIGT
jgi:hypothetical protein